MVKAQSEPVSEKELEEESDIEDVVEKDGLNSVNVTPDDTNYDSETYVGKPAQKEEEKAQNNKSYIQQRKSYSMSNVDKNKLMNTRIGDHINYFDNGRQNSGIVTKMNSSFLTIVKEDGIVHDVHINDTFFVSDILVNKTWNDMNMEERTVELQKVHAYSPRYLGKTWEQLPKELRETMKVDPKIQAGAVDFNKQPSLDESAAAFNKRPKAGAGAKQFNRKPSLQESAINSLEKEGDGSSGVMGTGTEGAHNTTYNPKPSRARAGSKQNRSLGKTGEYTYSEKPEYKTKGIPEDTGNSWGIKYIKKEEDKE
jgi:hypothetical protein